MDDQIPAASETEEPEGLAGGQTIAVPKRRPALSKAKRELTDSELKSPAVNKLLMDDLDRLEQERSELADYRERFHETDKQLGITREKLKKTIAAEVVATGCLVVGGAALGYVPTVWTQQPTGYISLAFGVMLLIAGIVAKVVKS
jgi:hypothetical protein